MSHIAVYLKYEDHPPLFVTLLMIIVQFPAGLQSHNSGFTQSKRSVLFIFVQF